MSSTRRIWSLVIAWAALIFVLSSIPGHSFPQSELLSHDKLLHALVYSVLGGLSCLALRRGTTMRTSRIIALAAALTTFYGITDELHQLLVPGRVGDLRDVLADAVGGLVGAASLAGVPMAKARSA